MTIHTLASGSEGNCLLLSDGGVHLLLDAGISTRRIKAGLLQLGLTMADVDGVLITHEHSDHVSGLQTMVKHHCIPIYTSPPPGSWPTASPASSPCCARWSRGRCFPWGTAG